MDAIMELIFVLAGHAIRFMGIEMCIILIALMPMYLYFSFMYMNNLAVLNSRTTILFLVLSMISSLLLSVVFGISAIALGAWG